MDTKVMKAAVFEGNGKLTVKEIAVPQITNATDVLIEVEVASICGSDLHILNVPPGQYGEPGTTMGHEFVGRISAKGSQVTSFEIGDRVVVEPNIRCGYCPECRNGLENLCRNAQNIGQWRDGGFADYCVVPQKQIYVVPESISLRTASLIEPLACVMHGMIKVNPMPFEKVVLFGAGAIGLMFLSVLKAFGVRKIAVGETFESRRKEAEKFGAEFTFNPAVSDWKDHFPTDWNGTADLVIDAVGAGSVFEQAIDVVGVGGRILIFGQNMTQVSSVHPGTINVKQISIVATLSTLHSFEPAIKLLQIHDLNLESLITHEFPLKEIHAGIEVMRSKQAEKVLIYPNEIGGK